MLWLKNHWIALLSGFLAAMYFYFQLRQWQRHCDDLTIRSDGRRSLLTLLTNDNKSRNCSSFWLRFAESRQSSTCLVSGCADESPKLVSSNQASATRNYFVPISSEYPATIRIDSPLCLRII
jgi:hypothetical protein